MDVSSETSTPRAPVLQLCPGLMSLQCGLPLEDWDDHPLCASCRALDDLPCQGLFACPVCAQWPEDKRQRFLATQSITTGQRGTSFLSPPPWPELTFVLLSALGRSGHAACPLSARTTTVHGVYRPTALATGHPVFCASPFELPGVGSTQRGGRRIRPCLQRLLPRHVARPGLLVTAHAHLYRPTRRVSGLPVYIILGARLRARTMMDTTARRTRLHISLPCHPSPVRSTVVTDVTVATAHARLRRRLPLGTVGALAPTSTAAPRGVDTPFHSIDRPSFRTVIKGDADFTTSLPAPKRGIPTPAAPCQFPPTPTLVTSLQLNRQCRNALPCPHGAPTWTWAVDARRRPPASHAPCHGTRRQHAFMILTGTCYGERTLSLSLRTPRASPSVLTSRNPVSRTIITAFLASLTLPSLPLCPVSSVYYSRRTSLPHAPSRPSWTPMWPTSRCSWNVQPPSFLSRTGSSAQSWNCHVSSPCRHDPTPWRLDRSCCILHLGQATMLKTTSRTCSLIWSYIVVMLIFGTPSLHCLRPLNVCCAHTGSTADNSLTTRPARPPWRCSHMHPTSRCWPRLLSPARLHRLVVLLLLTPITAGARLPHPGVNLPGTRSRSTRGKPRSFPSSSKKGGADLRTSIDLSPTDLSPSPATVPPLPDFPIPALNDSPVGARLQLYWCNWQRISADPWVISVLHDGYYLPFSADPPPLTSDPPLLSYSRPHPLFQELTSQVQALLAKGAIEQTDFSPGFYSCLFLAPKQNRDWHPVIDLSALNRYLSSHALPHGDGMLSYAVPPAGGLVHLCRPEGRFPACPHRTQAPQVPTLQDRGRCLSVPCTPFWLDHFSPRLHSHCQDSGGLRTFSGAQHVTLPGRLEHFSPVAHPLHAVDGMGPTPHCFPRTHPKPTQVRPDATSAVCVHQHSVRPEHWHGTPCPPQSRQLFTTAERLPVVMGTPSGEVATPVGPHDFLGETDQAGASPHASCSVHAPWPMVTVIGPPSSCCAHYTRASSGPTVVVSFSQPHLRSAPPPASAGPTSVHWCLQWGLGGSPLAPDRGPLGLGPETSAHQRSGASGHPPGPAALPAPCPGPAGNGYDRQHYSCRSAAQSGGRCQGPFTATLPNCCSGPTVTTSA